MTSDRAGELLALAERVEAASGADRELDCRLWCAVCPPDLPYGIDEWMTCRPVPAHHETVGLTLSQWMDRWPDQIDATAKNYHVPSFTASLDAALSLVPEGWRVSALEQDWQTGLWRAQLAPKPSPALIASYVAGRTVGWETADAPSDGCAAIATPALALVSACLRALASRED